MLCDALLEGPTCREAIKSALQKNFTSKCKKENSLVVAGGGGLPGYYSQGQIKKHSPFDSCGPMLVAINPARMLQHMGQATDRAK